MRVEAMADKPGTVPGWVFLCIVSAAGLIGALIAWNTAVTAVVFLTLCACLLSWKKPVAVIGGLAFYVPVERFLTVQLPDLAFVISQASGEVVALALLAGVLLRRAALRRSFVSTPLDLALLGFIAACVLSAIANGVAMKPTAYGIRIVLRYAIVFYAIVNGGFTRREMKLIVGAYLGAAALQIGVGLLQALTGGAAKEWFTASREVSFGDVTFARGQNIRGIGEGMFTVVFGTLENYNAYGMFLAMAWLVALAASRSGRHLMGAGKVRALLLLGFACVMLSFSRSSLLVILVGLAVISYMSGNRKLGLAVVILLVSGLGLIAYIGAKYSGQDLPVYSTNLVYRWVRPFTPDRLAWEEAGNYRLFLLFVMSVRVMSESPVFGLGPGTFGSALTMWPGSALYGTLGMHSEYAVRFAADSNWITILAQTGLVGLACFAFIVFGMMAYSVRTYGRTADPFLRGLCLVQIGVTIAIVLAGFFGPFFESRYTSFYFWVMSGLVVALARSEGMPSGRGLLRRLLGKGNRR